LGAGVEIGVRLGNPLLASESAGTVSGFRLGLLKYSPLSVCIAVELLLPLQNQNIDKPFNLSLRASQEKKIQGASWGLYLQPIFIFGARIRIRISHKKKCQRGMGTRVPVQHYNLRSTNSFIGSPLHDLNTVDARPANIEAISDVDRDAVTDDSLDNDDDSNAVVSFSLFFGYTTL
jgi:hypothetical protein